MEEESQPVEIICPCCYSLVTIDAEKTIHECTSCQRMISEEDIAESVNNNEN